MADVTTMDPILVDGVGITFDTAGGQMDEPFGALDEITRDRLNEELLNIWQLTGTTVVFVTHSIAEAVFLSQRVVVMSAQPGRISEVHDIDLPGERSRAVRSLPQFAEYEALLRRALEGA